MSKLVLYHGSDHIVGQPVFEKCKPDNDYGTGFYCTESIELAKEWACGERGQDGYANAYNINTDRLNILNLSDEKYNILNWLAILIKNRRFSATVPIAQAAKQYIIENFFVDIAPYDIIIGYLRMTPTSPSQRTISATRSPLSNYPARCAWASSASRWC